MGTGLAGLGLRVRRLVGRLVAGSDLVNRTVVGIGSRYGTRTLPVACRGLVALVGGSGLVAVVGCLGGSVIRTRGGLVGIGSLRSIRFCLVGGGGGRAGRGGAHRHQQRFVRHLNRFYNEHPTLWQRAFESDGFEWIDADNADQSIISFIRRGDDPKEDLVVLINFDVNAREDFRMGVPEWGVYEELFNTDNERFGGSGVLNTGKIKCQDEPWNGREQSIVVRVPPLGGMILKKTGAQRRPAKKTASSGAAKAKKPASKAQGKKAAEKDAKPAAKKAATKKPAAKKAPAVRGASEQKPVAKKKASTE